MTETPTNAFRVLVVDDDPSIHGVADDELSDLAAVQHIRIEVAHALTTRDALTQIRGRFFDLVLLDLYRNNKLVGYEVYRGLDQLRCSVEVLIMTHLDLGPEVKPLMELFAAPGGPKFVAFLDKRDGQTTSIGNEVSKRLERFQQTDGTFLGVEMIARLLDRRRKRYERPKLFPMRPTIAELHVEIDRILRKLYVRVPSESRRSQVRVEIYPIDRRGLSAAVVVNAVVLTSFRDADHHSPGHKTVLKIGPRPEIVEEASRFQEYVRFGVELDQRVEMLGVAEGDSLAGIVYSFAGGLHRKELRAFDEVIATDLAGGDDVGLSREVARSLFDSRHWYDVAAGRVRLGQYFSENYRTSLTRSAKASEEYLLDLPDELGGAATVERLPAGRDNDEPMFRLTLPAREPLSLPGSSVLGWGPLLKSVPQCLIHGDMHAGNVMLELSVVSEPVEGAAPNDLLKLERVCLIDFRSAGPGPRCMDAVALESSVRLGDSEARCRLEDPRGERFLSPDRRGAIAEAMVDRFASEMALYRSVFLGDGPEPADAWAQVASSVLKGLRVCFPDVTLLEYLSVSVRHTLRSLGYDLLPVARVRLLTWLSAQYSLAQTVASGAT